MTKKFGTFLQKVITAETAVYEKNHSYIIDKNYLENKDTDIICMYVK